MNTIVNLYSSKSGEIERFLNKFFESNVSIKNNLKWEMEYQNPIEIADIIGAFIDNNANQIIKYLYERFPY